MKRTFMILAALLVVAGIAAAQPVAPAPNAPAASKLEGRLSLVNGFVGIQTKDKTYYVHIPGRLYGFIDGLKEGAQVKLEGYEEALPQAPEYAHFFVTKLAIGGKEYDLSASFRGGTMGGRWDGRMGGRRGGRMGGGMMRGPGGRFQDDDWNDPRGGRL